MPKGGIIGLLTTLAVTAQFASGQLEPDCNPLKADCQPKKALPNENYYIDFTKQTTPPQDWIIANDEAVNFTSNGAEFAYAKEGDAPSMWTGFYMLGGRYDIEMKIAPGQGVISSAALWSDIQDEIDYEFSGNQFGQTPFPPQDGMWAVETNVFAQGKMWDGAATYQKDSYKPAEQFHKYSVEWDEDHMNWYVDDKIVRSIQAKDTPSGFTFPQSPMKLQLGVWGGGDPSNSYWTKQWAGGEIDLTGAPYTMHVKSVSITNKYPACQYRYNDKSGKISSIEKITDGCNPSALNPARLAKKDYPVSSPSSAATEAETSTGYPTSAGYPTYDASSLFNTRSFTTAESPSTYLASPPSSHSTTSSPAEYPTYSASSPSASHSSSTEEEYPTSKDESSSSSHSTTSPAEYPTYPASSPSASHSSSTEEEYPTSKDEPSSSSHSSTSTLDEYPTSMPGSSSVVAHSSTSLTESLSTYPAASVSSASHSASSASSASSPLSVSASSSTHASSATTPEGYPVSPPVSSEYSTSSPGSSGYPMSSPSSSRAFLSSLSSLILGTTSSTLAVSSSSIPQDTYPTAPLSASSSTLASSGSTGAISSSGSSSLPGSSSGYSVSSSAIHSGTSSSASNSVYTYPMSSGSAIVSTIYSTNIYTITSCASTVTDCPVGKVTTELVSVSTTMSSATEVESSTPVTSKTINSVSTATHSSSYATGSSSSSALESTSKTETSSLSYQTSGPSSSSRTMPSTYSVSSEITSSIMSTVYTTNIVTITSCPPSVTNCPVGQVTTETKSLYTTICPITKTVLDGTTYGETGTVEGTSFPSAGFTYSLSSFYPSSVRSAASSSFSSAYPVSSSARSAETSSSAQSSSTGSLVVSSGSSVGTSSSLLSSSSGYSMSTPVVSAGTSSSILSSSVIYENSTVSTSGSVLAASSTYSASSEKVSSSETKLTTSTVYSTNVYTITSCAPDVTNCPGKLGQVTTELVSLYTTVCPVTESHTTAQVSSSALPVASQTSAPSQTISSYATLNSTSSSRVMTTSTVYTSSIYTVSTCKPGEAECSSKIGSITTETVPLYTTVCPVEETETASLKTATSSIALGKSSVTQIASSYATSVSGSQIGSSTSQAASSYSTSTQSHAVPVSSYTTSTVYSTKIYTVTSCAPSVTNCPAKGSVTTEIVAVSTTVCPVSDESRGVPGTLIPAVTGGSQYSTATITLSNTLSGSVIVVTSTISFIDTPVPYPTQVIGTTSSAGTAATGEVNQSITKPATTVTLGNYFTTTIVYETITPPHGPPASVSSGAIPTSYYTASSSGIRPTSVPVAVSEASSYPVSSDDITNTRTVYETRTSQVSVASTCACDVPTVTVTVTSTVQPPFPSGYAVGTAPINKETDAYPTSKPGVVRKWFRRGHGNDGGHGITE